MHPDGLATGAESRTICSLLSCSKDSTVVASVEPCLQNYHIKHRFDTCAPESNSPHYLFHTEKAKSAALGPLISKHKARTTQQIRKGRRKTEGEFFRWYGRQCGFLFSEPLCRYLVKSDKWLYNSGGFPAKQSHVFGAQKHIRQSMHACMELSTEKAQENHKDMQKDEYSLFAKNCTEIQSSTATSHQVSELAIQNSDKGETATTEGESNNIPYRGQCCWTVEYQSFGDAWKNLQANEWLKTEECAGVLPESLQNFGDPLMTQNDSRKQKWSSKLDPFSSNSTDEVKPLFRCLRTPKCDFFAPMSDVCLSCRQTRFPQLGFIGMSPGHSPDSVETVTQLHGTRDFCPARVFSQAVQPERAQTQVYSHFIDLSEVCCERWSDRVAVLRGAYHTPTVGQKPVYLKLSAPQHARLARRSLRQLCKSFQRQQKMVACFRSWLAFCRKVKELRLRQELQHLRSLRTMAMSCLDQWTCLFVAVGARRIFLSLRCLSAFTLFVLHTRQCLLTAVQAHERSLKCKVLSCLRKMSEKKGLLQDILLSLETANTMQFRRRHWIAWVGLLREREVLRWAICTTVKATASISRAFLAGAFNNLRAAASAALDRNECKIRHLRGCQARRILQQWRGVAHRMVLQQVFTMRAAGSVLWSAWRAWRQMASETMARSRQQEKDAQEFYTKYINTKCLKFFGAWKNYSFFQKRLQACAGKYLLNWKRRVFTELKLTYRESQIFKVQLAKKSSDTLKRAFSWWLVNFRRQRRDAAVSRLLLAEAMHSLIRESFFAWAHLTANLLRARAVHQRLVKTLHWKRWRKIVSSLRHRKHQGEELAARSRTSCLFHSFHAWIFETQQVIRTKSQLFTSWRRTATYWRRLSKAEYKVKALKERTVLSSLFSIWQMEARTTRLCRKLHHSALCRKGIYGLKRFRERVVRARRAKKLISVRNRRYLLSNTFEQWKKQQFQLQKQQSVRLHAPAKLWLLCIQPWWMLWRRKTEAATSLRSWVAQAVSNPIQKEALLSSCTTLQGAIRSADHQCTAPRPVAAAADVSLHDASIY